MIIPAGFIFRILDLLCPLPLLGPLNHEVQCLGEADQFLVGEGSELGCLLDWLADESVELRLLNELCALRMDAEPTDRIEENQHTMRVLQHCSLPRFI